MQSAMEGFFRRTELTQAREPPSMVPRCAACGLWKACASPKMEAFGQGKRNVLLVGEAPGRTEDERGRQFVGKAGKRLRQTLEGLGVDMDVDCVATNSLVCRPPGNRTPSDKEITYCRPNLLRLIDEMRPAVIVLLGGPAVQSLIGWLWKDDPGRVTRWAGWCIPSRKLNSWVCPTFHPSHVMRREDERDTVTAMYFEEHLRRAFKLKGKPYEEVPDLNKSLIVETDVKAAAWKIHNMMEAGEPLSWDIETNMLKPDSTDAEIVCCSVSDGIVSVAYPWHGDAINATCEFLQSDVPKMGWSIKFETRWLKAKLGINVRNWVWDGMLAAHVLDNRPEITGLKFQTFARLGVGPYDEHVSPYLKGASPGANSKNRIREVDLRSLLTYCATDSLLEHQVGQLQAKEMGVEL